jgi:hypothetical protein
LIGAKGSLDPISNVFKIWQNEKYKIDSLP